MFAVNKTAPAMGAAGIQGVFGATSGGRKPAAMGSMPSVEGSRPQGGGPAAQPPVAPLGSFEKQPASSASKQARSGARVLMYDMSDGVERPIQPSEHGEFSDPAAQTAHKNALAVDGFLRTAFKRNGWDDKGSPLHVVVHAKTEDGTPLVNATWDLEHQRIHLGDGDGQLLAPLGNSLDVMMHETSHAVVDSEVRLEYEGQSGGINESWADVIGALADPEDWLIGEDVMTPGIPGDAIRDLSAPRYAHMDDVPPGVDDVHDLSGIPSLAAVRVADKVGRPEMGQIWYRALVDHMEDRTGFSGAATATLRAAKDLFGEQSKQFGAVRDAWTSVGIQAAWQPVT